MIVVIGNVLAGLLGLSRVTAPTRRYPNGSLAANLIGGWVDAHDRFDLGRFDPETA